MLKSIKMEGEDVRKSYFSHVSILCFSKMYALMVRKVNFQDTKEALSHCKIIGIAG